ETGTRSCRVVSGRRASYTTQEACIDPHSHDPGRSSCKENDNENSLPRTGCNTYRTGKGPFSERSSDSGTCAEEFKATSLTETPITKGRQFDSVPGHTQHLHCQRGFWSPRRCAES